MSHTIKKLTHKHEAFKLEYLRTFKPKEAAIHAGFNPRSAASTASRLLKSPCMIEAIDQELKKRAKDSEVTQERIVKELAKIAFADPRKLYDGSGNLLPVCKLDADTAAALGTVEAVELASCGGTYSEVKKMRLIDKKGALDSLARHLGMFTDKQQITGADGGPVEYKNLSDRELDARIQVLIGKQQVTVNK